MSESSAADAVVHMALPVRVGPYRILGLLGEGATGRVYLAEESNPPREVALKVLRAATLPVEARKRFRREAELLARLEHPAIARLYAAGVAETEAGPLPYLAMERVQGEELLGYARRHALDLRGRLTLLAEIGHAVHYAHSRGIVHRDLKPANIWVDADGHPHILDFGLAHMVRDDVAAMTLNGQVFGTVPYMSVEQLAGSRAADDPRSDVYALGVIAYELLSGRLPFPGLSTSTVLEAIGIIREARVEPLSRLVPATRGDVETVVMKAMAQEPRHRYGSASELAADVERYLQHRPIEARPPTARYLLRLFVRRHRALSVAAMLIVAVLGIATIVSTRFGFAERNARREADQQRSEVVAVNRFLSEMLLNADPNQSRGKTLTLRETLDGAVRTLAANHTLPPYSAAVLYGTLGEVYAQLGEIGTSLSVARDGMRRVSGQLPDDEAAMVHLRLVEAIDLRLTGKITEAETVLEPLLQLPRRDGEANRDRINAMAVRGILYCEKGRQGQCGDWVRRAYQEAAETLGPIDQATLENGQNALVVTVNEGRFLEALPIAQLLIERQTAVLGKDHPLTMMSRQELVNIKDQLGELDEAVVLMKEIVADRERVLGPAHYSTLQGISYLSRLLTESAHPDEALPLAQRAYRGLMKTSGPANLHTLTAQNFIANSLEKLGRDAEAERTYRDNIAAWKASGSADTAASLAPISNLARLLARQARYEEADALYRDLLPRAQKALGPQHSAYGTYLAAYGQCLARQGQMSQAETYLENGMSVMQEQLSAQSSELRDARANLLTIYRARGEMDKAAALEART